MADEIKLPPLPVCFSRFNHQDGQALYSADQMTAYGMACLEAAAKVAEGQAIMTDDQGLIQLGDVEFIAECIRSMAATQQGDKHGKP